MQDLHFNEEIKNDVISVIKDPFIQENIIGITIRYNGDGWLNQKPYWYVRVDFKNGNTKGEHYSPNRESMEEVLIDLKQILDSVKNK
jgi:hypothetical protein